MLLKVRGQTVLLLLLTDEGSHVFMVWVIGAFALSGIHMPRDQPEKIILHTRGANV